MYRVTPTESHLPAQTDGIVRDKAVSSLLIALRERFVAGEFRQGPP